MTELTRASAEEIRVNPDKSWLDSLMDRYKAFLRSKGHNDEVESIDKWRDGTAEETEAHLRNNGHGEAK